MREYGMADGAPERTRQPLNWRHIGRSEPAYMGGLYLGPGDVFGYQGAAQHTYTRSCDGLHEPGRCKDAAPVEVTWPVAGE
jgi:hypothetical protein